MSNWREYPPPELQQAIDWLKEKGEDQARVLLHHLQELIITRRNYFFLCEYRRSTEARNVLAKQLFVALYQGKMLDYVRGDKAEHEMQKCLEIADIFLEQSGEKKVVAEEVEQTLREVLGW